MAVKNANLSGKTRLFTDFYKVFKRFYVSFAKFPIFFVIGKAYYKILKIDKNQYFAKKNDIRINVTNCNKKLQIQ